MVGPNLKPRIFEVRTSRDQVTSVQVIFVEDTVVTTVSTTNITLTDIRCNQICH